MELVKALDSCDVKGKVERVKHFAERNLHKKISLEDAASAVSLSPKYLSRIFKQETGKGFSEYRSGLRMQKARELLEIAKNGGRNRVIIFKDR